MSVLGPHTQVACSTVELGSDQRGHGKQQKTGVLMRKLSNANRRRSEEEECSSGDSPRNRVLGGKASRVRCPGSKAEAGLG